MQTGSAFSKVKRIARRVSAVFAEPKLCSEPPHVLYSSYAAAMRTCTGYECSDLLDVVQAKTAVLRDGPTSRPDVALEPEVHSLLSILLAQLADGPKPILKVLDFGGACGAHYYRIRRCVPFPLKLQWVIVETPAMVERANTLAEGNAEICAVESVARARQMFDGRPDLVHASGALQCTPDPYAALDDLLSVRAPVLLVTRGAVTTGNQELIVVHNSPLSANGPGPLPPQFSDRTVSYPFVFALRSRIIEALESVYHHVLLLPDATGYFGVNQEPVSGLAALAMLPREASAPVLPPQ